jgi:hypothetical protein
MPLLFVFTGFTPCLSQVQTDSLTVKNDTIIVYDIFEKLSETSSDKGKIVLGGDNVKSIIQENKTVKKNIKGCRIRIFKDNSQTARQKAENIKANIERTYPGLPVYVTHLSPNFHVDCGDFRNQDEAEKMRRILTAAYPGTSLVNVTINLPPL